MFQKNVLEKIKTLIPCSVTFFSGNGNVYEIMSIKWYKHNIILNSVRQHNHCITRGNYKATCFN